MISKVSKFYKGNYTCYITYVDTCSLLGNLRWYFSFFFVFWVIQNYPQSDKNLEIKIRKIEKRCEQILRNRGSKLTTEKFDRVHKTNLKYSEVMSYFKWRRSFDRFSKTWCVFCITFSHRWMDFTMSLSSLLLDLDRIYISFLQKMLCFKR